MHRQFWLPLEGLEVQRQSSCTSQNLTCCSCVLLELFDRLLGAVELVSARRAAESEAELASSENEVICAVSVQLRAEFARGSSQSPRFFAGDLA
jgi:hypothetical protein